MTPEKARQKFKLLTETFLEEIFEIYDAKELVKKQIQAKKNILAVAGTKKTDNNIQELTAIIKKHREKSYEENDFTMDTNKYTLNQIQGMVKRYKEDVDKEIEESIAKKKDLEKSFNEQIKQYKQQILLIDILLEKRI